MPLFKEYDLIDPIIIAAAPTRSYILRDRRPLYRALGSY
ncbi:hypothetical protein VTL71DRAFT_3642 [Oculimacula yallundae]|uniref:Uncharacterized protein n=1 Tax=Oculimacula yallundae TaxID=86028 RepID=A0ABR4C3M3_9HELO